MDEISKQDAAQYLGISLRALERYTQQGRIGVKYIKGKRGRQARYQMSELEELKRQLEEPIHRPALANYDNVYSLAPISQSQPLVSMDDPSSLIDSLIALTDAIKSNPVLVVAKTQSSPSTGSNCK